MYFVYMHVSPTGKRYIGITKSNPPKYRWGKDGKGYRGHTHFWFAIQHYGWDNFEHIIVAGGLTKEEACQMEIDLIAKYNTTNSEYGYNLSTGGESSSGTKRTPEQCKAISERMRGNLNRVHKNSPEERKRTSERMKGNTFGAYRNITDEYKERALLGQPHRRVIYQYTFDGDFVAEYRSLNEAFRQTGIWNIGEASRRKSKFGSRTTGGYIWIRGDDVTENMSLKDLLEEKLDFVRQNGQKPKRHQKFKCILP